MIELSSKDNEIRYNYKKICDAMGWKATGGDARRKQLDAIEEAYEFYHPMNYGTHQPRKEYVFTAKLKEVELVDGRKNNGGGNGFPKDDFNYLLWSFLYYGWNRNAYRQGRMEIVAPLGEVYATNSVIYEEFGFPVYQKLDSVKPEIPLDEAEPPEWVRFKQLCVGIVRSATISRICRLFNFKKNNLPKGILRQKSKYKEFLVPDDKLLKDYDEVWEATAKKHGCKNWNEIFKKDAFMEIRADVQESFETRGIYRIVKTNMLLFSYEQWKDFFPTYDRAEVKEKQALFADYITKSIAQSVNRLVSGESRSKWHPSPTEKEKLLSYVRALESQDEGQQENESEALVA